MRRIETQQGQSPDLHKILENPYAIEHVAAMLGEIGIISTKIAMGEIDQKSGVREAIPYIKGLANIANSHRNKR